MFRSYSHFYSKSEYKNVIIVQTLMCDSPLTAAVLLSRRNVLEEMSAAGLSCCIRAVFSKTTVVIMHRNYWSVRQRPKLQYKSLFSSN